LVVVVVVVVVVIVIARGVHRELASCEKILEASIVSWLVLRKCQRRLLCAV